MMDDQKILDNNPVGFYTNVSMSNGKPFIWTCNNFRSLADIRELVELRKANAGLEKVVDDLLNNSSFSINFPFEHDNLEKLRGK
jgi:hypothetical protein